MRLFIFVIGMMTFTSLSYGQVRSTTPQDNVGSDIPTIFDVRKSLPMEPDEPAYHDFYINAGTDAGFKKGQYLPVARYVPVHDPIQNKQQGILTIPVGKIQVIHVERTMTVARLVSELSDDERPTVEYEAIMIGDKVDMKGITMEAPKEAPKKKKKRATAANESADTMTAVLTVGTSVAPAAVAVPVAAPAPVPVSAPAAVSSQAPAPLAPVPATAPAASTTAPAKAVPAASNAPLAPSSERVSQPVPPAPAKPAA